MKRKKDYLTSSDLWRYVYFTSSTMKPSIKHFKLCNTDQINPKVVLKGGFDDVAVLTRTGCHCGNCACLLS
jgi:hypothetical protein